MHQPASRTGEEGHSLDGIRLRLPVPQGHHHAEVVAALARWIGRRYELEPFDLQVSDGPEGAAGVLSMRAYPPGRKLDLYVKRSHEAVQRADLMAVSAARIQGKARLTRDRARLLTSEGRRQRELSRQLRSTTAALRQEWTNRLAASASPFTGRP